jgi:ribosomal protein L34E
MFYKTKNKPLSPYRVKVMNEVAKMAKEMHASVSKNCEKHPMGGRHCPKCSASRIMRQAIGEFLAELK